MIDTLWLIMLPALGGVAGVMGGFMTDRPEDGDHTLAPWFGVAGGIIGFVVAVLIHISGF